MGECAVLLIVQMCCVFLPPHMTDITKADRLCWVSNVNGQRIEGNNNKRRLSEGAVVAKGNLCASFSFCILKIEIR
jgi:hypothetical protein